MAEWIAGQPAWVLSLGVGVILLAGILIGRITKRSVIMRFGPVVRSLDRIADELARRS